MGPKEVGNVTNVLGCETVGRSKLLDVIGVVGERMDLIRGKIKQS